ncbi:MSHA biogenesis protein MshM [Alishewanella longhuensis]|uniref:MSHA biogenesis protein MshM n=1 Tax=Alishewanella longhuensis TaxID=1091037 RepID=A0ABQ3KXC8_9ALTE|nr:AAA family ATPase [Alishewanella longhuensis]GHG67834.1 MSHA biogenesis protein MshM [Alishewanella longhuensis]
MYAGFFQLTQTPFSLTPDTSFYLSLPQHEAALAVLRTALNSGEGFIKVTGEVGTGKTLLCRLLLTQAPADWQLAYIPDPTLTPLELRWALAQELGLKFSANIDAPQLLQLLQRQLILLAGQQKRVVLVIDEAQALPDATLETLRLLTNLETEQQKLLQVVLFGQPELDQRLAANSLRQLRQRITFSHQLEGMTSWQVKHYIAHRLKVAGCERPVFSEAALSLLHFYSKGIPRLINILAHKCLMLAYGEGQHSVTWRHMRYAAADTESVAHFWHRVPLLGSVILWLGAVRSRL